MKPVPLPDVPEPDAIDPLPKFKKWVESVTKQPNAQGLAFAYSGKAESGYLKEVWKNMSTNKDMKISLQVSILKTEWKRKAGVHTKNFDVKTDLKKEDDPSDSARKLLTLDLKPGQEFGYIVENGTEFCTDVGAAVWSRI